jgi:hypothetical protein
MSGGSFNYLYRRDALDEEDVRALVGMAKVATECGANADAVAALVELSGMLRNVFARRDELANLLQAIEWYKSCDWSAGQVVESAESLRAEGVFDDVGEKETSLAQHALELSVLGPKLLEEMGALIAERKARK